jgi:hypothetical protein
MRQRFKIWNPGVTIWKGKSRCNDLERQVEFWKNKCTSSNDNINNSNNEYKKRKYKRINKNATEMVNICNLIDEIEKLASVLHDEYECFEVNPRILSNAARDAKSTPILFISTILDLMFSQNIVDFLRRSTLMRSKIK